MLKTIKIPTVEDFKMNLDEAQKWAKKQIMKKPLLTT